jgi:hypothetical protein
MLHGDSHQVRIQAVLAAQGGGLIMVPGHVLTIVGWVSGEPYVMQGVSFAVFCDSAKSPHDETEPGLGHAVAAATGTSSPD